MSRLITMRLFVAFFVFCSFQYARADAAKLCRVGIIFKKYDRDSRILAETMASGATLAKDPALCQSARGERFVVMQLNPGFEISFLVVRGLVGIEEVRKILAKHGYVF